MKQCARCGIHIKEETNRIRCKKCLEKVHEELEGKADRPLKYYFKNYYKMRGHQEEMLRQ